jgi:hypothetical protein
VITCPYELNATRQVWQSREVLKYAPDHLVPEGWYIEGEDEDLDAGMTARERREKLDRAERANKGFRNGLVKGQEVLHFWPTAGNSDVLPLRSWYRPMLFWAPVIVCFLLFLVSMMAVVHPQWSQNELLPYPIAEFTAEMLRVEQGFRFPRMWYRRSFWVAFTLVFLIHSVRWLEVWHPETMVSVKIDWNLWGLLARTFPNYAAHNMGAGWHTSVNKLYLGVVAFAFFIPTDVSLSLGLSTAALGFLTFFLWKLGINYTGYHHQSTLAGAYFAMFAVVLFLGRHYYWRVFRAALGSRRIRDLDVHVVWAARVFLLSYAGLILLCTLSGLNLALSAAFVSSLGVLYLVLARVSAESGSPLVQAEWKPADMFVKLLGATALGPYSLAIMGLLTTALASDPRESLTCFLANGYKLAEADRVPRLKLAGSAFLVMIPCAALAFLMVLWVNYNGRGSDDYALTWPPVRSFDRVAEAVSQIQREPGLLERVSEIETGEGLFSFEGTGFRLRHWSVKPGVLPWVAVGMATILVSASMRLRFNWWLLHPVLFLIWGNWAAFCFAPSFFVGCLVKAVVVRIGGGRMYRDLRTFFMGAIMGEVMIACVIMAFNVWYYFHNDGLSPERYFIFPV